MNVNNAIAWIENEEDRNQLQLQANTKNEDVMNIEKNIISDKSTALNGSINHFLLSVNISFTCI